MDPYQEEKEPRLEDCLNGASGRLDLPIEEQKTSFSSSIQSIFTVLQLSRQHARFEQSIQEHQSVEVTATTIANRISSASGYVTVAAASVVTEGIVPSTTSTIYSTAGPGAANGSTNAHEHPPPLEALNERWQYFIVALYSTTALTSFILNVLTVIVLARCRRSELRKYLINLSLSDLLLSLLSIPFTYTEYMMGRWIFPAFLCPLVRFVVTLGVSVSVATMTVISINRYLAVIHPFKKETNHKQAKRAGQTHVILLIWLIGITISAPEYIVNRIKPFCYQRHYYFQCKQIWSITLADRYTIFIFVSTFILPFILLCYMYSSIGLKLWRHKAPGNEDTSRDDYMHTKRVKVIKMLVVVVLLFALCWLPLQAFSVVLYVFPTISRRYEYPSSKYDIFVGCYIFCHWLSTAHGCMNPFVYCFMNNNFRSKLYHLVCRRPYQSSDESLQRQYSLVYLSSASYHHEQSTASFGNGQLLSYPIMVMADNSDDFVPTVPANSSATNDNGGTFDNKENDIRADSRRSPRNRGGSYDCHRQVVRRRRSCQQHESTFPNRSAFYWSTSSSNMSSRFSNNSNTYNRQQQHTASTNLAYTDTSASTTLSSPPSRVVQVERPVLPVSVRTVIFDYEDDNGEEPASEDSYYTNDTDEELAGQPARAVNL